MLNNRTNTFLYTKGKEYSLDLEEYIGEYNVIGRDAYTGPTKTETSRKLVKYHPSKQVLKYNQLIPSNADVLTYVEPTVGLVYPTDENLAAGVMYRFFVKKRSDPRIVLEIDIEQASNYSKRNGIDPSLYQLGELKWKITTNINLLPTIKLENAKELVKLNRNMPGVSDIVFSFDEFSNIVI
jgi:hypothetical protein